MKRKAKIIAIVVIAILLASYIFINMTKPLEVHTIKVSQKDIIRNFKETATLKSQNELSITPAYADEVLFIIEEGKQVKKGDLLLSLSTKKLNYKKDELKAKLASIDGQEKMASPTANTTSNTDIAIKMAKDAMNRSIEDYNKYKILYDNGAISQTQFEQYRRIKEDASNNYHKIKNAKTGSSSFYDSQRDVINSLLTTIEDDLKNKDVYAPTDGVITHTFSIKGNISNPVAPIIQLADSSELIAECDILSSDAMALTEGQRVDIDIHIGQDSLTKTGEIVEISKSANTKVSSLGLQEQRVNVKIKCDEFKDLIIGCDMDITFETMHLKDKIAVPKTAVFKDNGQYYIWKIEHNKLKITQIEVGRDSDYDYEVLSGIELDDVIIIDANNTDLKEGKKISSK